MSDALPDRLIDAYECPHNHGPMPPPGHTHAGEAVNETCGDKCRIELRVEGGDPSGRGPGGIVLLAHHEATGCIISRAAASLLTDFVQGRPARAARLLEAADMLTLFDFPVAPLRQQCVLVAWRALQVALATPTPPGREQSDGGIVKL